MTESTQNSYYVIGVVNLLDVDCVNNAFCCNVGGKFPVITQGERGSALASGTAILWPLWIIRFMGNWICIAEGLMYIYKFTKIPDNAIF